MLNKWVQIYLKVPRMKMNKYFKIILMIINQKYQIQVMFLRDLMEEHHHQRKYRSNKFSQRHPVQIKSIIIN